MSIEITTTSPQILSAIRLSLGNSFNSVPSTSSIQPFIGNNNASGEFSSILGGQNNDTNQVPNTFIIGSNLTATLSDFTYVNNLTSVGIVNAGADIAAGRNITARGTISAGLGFFTEGRNSNNWSSVYTSVCATSGNWNSAYTSTTALNLSSIKWNSVYTNSSILSSFWSQTTEAVGLSAPRWNDSTSLVQTNSALWGTGGDPFNATLIAATSANWNSVYTNVNTLSDNWNSVYTDVNALSSDWNTAANWVYNNAFDGKFLNSVSASNASFPSLTANEVLVQGNLTVTGTATYINTNNLQVGDSLIYLASENEGNLLDIGIVAHFTQAPLGYNHTGLVRRAEQGNPGAWTLFSGLTTEPQTGVNIDWTDKNIVLDTLSANFIGDLNGNVTTAGGNSDQWNLTYTTRAYTAVFPASSINTIYGNNSSTGYYSTVASGSSNNASGDLSLVGSGTSNIASGNNSSVVGGSNNIASGSLSLIGSGTSNTASSNNSSVVGGSSNTSSGPGSSVIGGSFNNASGSMSLVGNGSCNTASSNSSSAFNGCCNTASGNSSSVFNGCCNTASGNSSSVFNGVRNTASCLYSNVINGIGNTASALYSNIINGLNNTVSGEYSSILNGKVNSVLGSNSAIFGGSNNTLSADESNIFSGADNFIGSPCSTILAGHNNIICTSASGSSTVISGYDQRITCNGFFSTIVGGARNTISGGYSAIVSGRLNRIEFGGGLSFIGAGRLNNTQSSVYSSIIAGQRNNTVGLSNVHILGSFLSATAADYTYTNNISAQRLVATPGGNSSNWNSTFVSMNTLSANWQNTFNTVQSNSATTWNYQGTDLKALSGNWQSAYTSWNGASATSIVSFNDTRFAKLSSTAYTLVDASNSIVPVLGSNTSSGTYAIIGGGRSNTASGGCSFVGGGLSNRAGNGFSAAIAGNANCAINSYATAVGGRTNIASGTYSNVVGGFCNTASGAYSTITGGFTNRASGRFSFVAAGSGNDTRGLNNTFMLGTNLSAVQNDFTYVNNLSSQGVVVAKELTVVGDISATGNIYGNSNINIQAGTAYTITNVDGGGIIGSTNTSTGLTASIVGTNYPIGFQTSLLQLGTASIIISAGPGIVLNQADSRFKTAKQYSAATLVNTGATGWVLFGDLSA